MIDLSGFTGTENYYKDQMGVLITDGVKYFAEKGKAYWCVSDMIVICKIHKKVKSEGFVSIFVKSTGENAVVEYSDGNGKKLFSQKYEFTDLEAGVYGFYFTDNTLLLRGEY